MTRDETQALGYAIAILRDRLDVEASHNATIIRGYIDYGIGGCPSCRAEAHKEHASDCWLAAALASPAPVAAPAPETTAQWECACGLLNRGESCSRCQRPRAFTYHAPETPAPDAMPAIEFGDDVVWQTKPKPERVTEVICAGSRYEKRMTIHEWREHFRHKQVTAIERNGIVIWRQEAQP